MATRQWIGLGVLALCCAGAKECTWYAPTLLLIAGLLAGVSLLMPKSALWLVYGFWGGVLAGSGFLLQAIPPNGDHLFGFFPICASIPMFVLSGNTLKHWQVVSNLRVSVGVRGEGRLKEVLANGWQTARAVLTTPLRPAHES
jgi:hypothetical protein